MTLRKPQPHRSLRTDAEEASRLCAGWNTRLAARRVTRFLDAQMTETGLTIAQFGLMAQVAAVSDDTLGALAARTGMEQSTLTRNLQALAREGFVEIAVVEGNQRRRMAWLTETGAVKLKDAMPVWRRAHKALGSLLAPELAQRLAGASEALDVQPGRRAQQAGGT
jgi:DNA-binding MarR family transcriptional regulator